MLVLSRKLNETIRVGGIEIEVLKIGRRSVRLGVTGPRSVPVIRVELLRDSFPPAERVGLCTRQT